VSQTKFAHYCSCGAKWAGTMDGRQYRGMKAIYWDRYHSGQGHEPTTPAKAGVARRKADEEARLGERRQ
jgi:hypothetical protein